jgi:[protein-PII] uridylyltransferase
MTPRLREARGRLVADERLRAAQFGDALSRVLDAAFAELLTGVELPQRWALVALGSYGRRELCPGSDIDVMFLHRGRGAVADAVSGLWYPLWDAGFVLGHSTRTVKEALALADADLDALTALLDTRLVGGDTALCAELTGEVRRLAQRRRKRVVEALAAAAAARLDRPGPVAEMLEPNLKDGAGGLRDVQSLAWAGWALGPPPRDADGPADGPATALATLVARGFLQSDDPAGLAAARATLLDVRVALHRVTRGRSDLLTLQEQDAVAASLGAPDADALVRGVSAAARTVSWIAADVWSRLRAAERGPLGRVARGDETVAEGVVLRERRVGVVAGAPVDAALMLRTAAAAARLGVDLDRASLERFRAEMGDPAWGPEERDSFAALLRAGRKAVPVFEALDHVGVLARVLPEWDGVRSLPQRNAYHRFTVDRHLLEAVAECAALLDDEGPDGDVARRARTDLLLLAALLHDVGKGEPGDHSARGADTARAIARRIGLDERGAETLVWLVRHHLLLAETATRRDLSEEAVVTRFGRAVGDTERLDLLYALTVGDSRATGPAAWTPTKAALVRELYLRTDALLERGIVVSPLATERRDALARIVGTREADTFLDAMPPAYTSAFEPEVLAHHRALLEAGRLAVEWSDVPDGRIECTVAAPDRTGLLATVAGVLALSGFDIRDAAGYSHRDGMALEVFTGVDRFGRLADDAGREAVVAALDQALRGTLQLDERLRDRARRYRTPAHDGGVDGVRVEVDLGASDFATVIEVHAPDHVGLLARVAAVFGDLDLDVSLAKVATLGDRVIDVFYVRDATGAKIRDPRVLERLRATLLAQLTSDVVLG